MTDQSSSCIGSPVQQCESREPNIAVQPRLLDFGSFETGQFKDLAVSATNTGTDPLNITNIELEGEDRCHFELPDRASSIKTLPPHESTSFTVRFAPRSGGPKTASIKVHSDDPDTPRIRVEAAGNTILRVHLRFMFIDPDGKVRSFPRGFRFEMEFEDGSSQTAYLGEDGAVLDMFDGLPGIEVERAKKSFTVNLSQAPDTFIACEARGKPERQELVTSRPSIRGYMREGRRLFLLPKDGWTLATADWILAGTGSGYNAETRRFESLEDLGVTVGSAGAPVTAILKLHCQHVRFEYYDRYHAHESGGRRVPVGIPPILLRGARSAPKGKATDYDTESNWTVMDEDPEKACQALPWIVRNKGGDELHLDAAKMLLEFGESGSFVFAKSRTEREIVRVPPGDPRLEPRAHRLQYYDLPRLWKSPNYYARFSGGGNPPGKSFGRWTEGELKAAEDRNRPVVFSLDDIVLVDRNGNQHIRDRDNAGQPVDLSGESRITLLYLDRADNFRVRVFNEMMDACYHSDLKFLRNRITEYHPDTRAVVFCSMFFDVYDKRTSESDPEFGFSKGDVCGARAARLYDADISGSEQIRGVAGGSAVGSAYAAKDCGNFELHYLHLGGVDGSTGKVISVLVTYWSGRFVANGVSEEIRQAHRNPGMRNAMHRWNDKDYEMEPLKSAGNDVLIKTFSLFEAKRDTRGGRSKCRVEVVVDNHPDGSWAALEAAQFEASGCQGEPGAYGAEIDAKQDYDGNTTSPLTAAHELGHATGLDDEYVYYTAITDSVTAPPLVEYDPETYYDGMPYHIDRLSIMEENHFPRMRHYWGRANWINSMRSGGLSKFLGTSDYKLVFRRTGSKPPLQYELTKPLYRDIYKPAYESASHTFGTSASSDLILYKLGNDEFAHDITAGTVYQGILVTRTRIRAVFVDGPAGAWSPSGKASWLSALGDDLAQSLDRRFRLEGDGGSEPNKDFKSIYLKFTPHCHAGPAVPLGSHFQLRVTRNGTDQFTLSGSTIRVGNACDNMRIIRFMFGLHDNTGPLTVAEGAAIARIIRVWAESVLGGLFNLVIEATETGVGLPGGAA